MGNAPSICRPDPTGGPDQYHPATQKGPGCSPATRKPQRKRGHGLVLWGVRGFVMALNWSCRREGLGPTGERRYGLAMA